MLSKYRKNPKKKNLLSFLKYCHIWLSSLVDDEQPTYRTNLEKKKKLLISINNYCDLWCWPKCELNTQLI